MSDPIAAGGFPVPQTFRTDTWDTMGYITVATVVDTQALRFAWLLEDTFTTQHMEDEMLELGQRVVDAIDGEGQPYESWCSECGRTSIEWWD